MAVLTAYYDLAVGPVSFDFCVFMVKAEMARRRAKFDRLHAVIVPFAAGVGGMFRDKTALYDVHEMRWRLWNICIPACQLLSASVTLAADWNQARLLYDEDRSTVAWPPDWDQQTLKNRRHLIGEIITAARAGEAVPRFSASEHARRKVRDFTGGRPFVTMTLRNTYLAKRNASRGDWLIAKKKIEDAGYRVLALEDTDVALSLGQGYGELNLDLRMACYQEAVLNLQANNGAASLCWFSDRPYRMFGAGVPPEEWDGLFVKQGLPLGETWPWASPGQKIVYGPTSAEQIIAEFESWAAGA